VGRLIEHLTNAERPIWLDDAAYAERLLAGGETPWFDSGEYVSFRRKAAALLKSDVITMPVGQMVAAWLRLHPDLPDAMAAKKRTIFPLRTLLGDPDMRAQLSDLAQGLQSCFPDAPFVLTLPSPRRWVADAYRLAHGADSAPDVGEDEIDSAAVYMADFLREFAEINIAGVLLEESEESMPQAAEEIEWYQPVLNVAEHYRWDVGVRQVNGLVFAADSGGADFVIAPKAAGGTVSGVSVDDQFWEGASPPDLPAGGFLFAEIPENGVPETVLERVAALHAGG
jgi:hypothetical protein